MTLSYVTLPLPVVPAPFRVRLLGLDSVEGLSAVYAEPEVARSLNYAVPLRAETIRQKLTRDVEAMHRGEGLRWVLSRGEDATPVGYLCLFNWSVKDRRAEVGYMLARALWGQSVMKLLLPELLRFGFEQMGLHRMEAMVAVHNTASLRVLTRAGFQQEGVLRGHHARANGEGFIDMFVLSMLEEEWRAAAAE
ncbi:MULTISPECIES: GNAT family N-acetyltransferase [Corallococcus]|uniref:GNAT family N-acetyltransferase n=1 Tax=Corallococcus TaxID=83461 RepID=UPI00117E84D8|nr:MULTISPECIES: GNAT family N-acetyltransferase [Corallococcus]NBD12056.1 GNAT family N-acetyltransferase [Corallococcus silvisoli]TSC26055.1 GNAT family N-acetyltransferase [Corallococcus sp. Z5C101001]